MCKRVMEDAMFVTKRCCFRTYCDGCIRDRLKSAGTCSCGAPDVSVDHLVPNVTLRKMIARLLVEMQSNCSSSSDSSNDVIISSRVTIETN
ncbi:E3 ubiquitin ligase PQT3-like [Linum perenne]